RRRRRCRRRALPRARARRPHPAPPREGRRGGRGVPARHRNALPGAVAQGDAALEHRVPLGDLPPAEERKSTRPNTSHGPESPAATGLSPCPAPRSSALAAAAAVVGAPFPELAREARARLRHEKVAEEAAVFRRGIAMRYQGQWRIAMPRWNTASSSATFSWR